MSPYRTKEQEIKTMVPKHVKLKYILSMYRTCMYLQKYSDMKKPIQGWTGSSSACAYYKTLKKCPDPTSKIEKVLVEPLKCKKSKCNENSDQAKKA